jgi:3-oxoacyl-[acyl-carrier protein] reductase
MNCRLRFKQADPDVAEKTHMKKTTILITGASRGIGRATAERLAKNGYDVVGLARSRGEGTFPGHLMAADLSDPDTTQAALVDVTSRFEIHGLVNNLGLNILQPLGSIDLASFARVIDVNIRVSIQCAQAVLAGMKRRRRGRIVNIASRAVLGRNDHTSYGAAKAGMIGMTRTWALELAEFGITANVVAPGPTATEMFRKDSLTEYGAPNGKPLEFFTNRIPMGRLGEPDEIAAAIEFFLSDGASFTTGQVLYVCGGLSIGTAAV